jgi:hypothetical protein
MRRPPPSRRATRRESPVGGQPGEQRRVFDVGLAPEVHDRELAGAQEPGERLRADAEPPLRFGEGNQLWRRGQFQGEVLLPRGRARSGAWASGCRWHRLGFPSEVQSVRRAAETHIADPSGRSRD